MVAIFFDMEYLRNDMRQSHSTSIGNARKTLFVIHTVRQVSLPKLIDTWVRKITSDVIKSFFKIKTKTLISRPRPRL